MHTPKLDKNVNTKLEPQQTAAEKGVSSHIQRDPLVQQISRMGNAPNPSAHAAVLNRAPANQQSSNRQLLLQLQQQYGNPYVNQVLQLAREMGGKTSANPTEQPLVQTKVTIGAVGDKYEQEADRTAHQVVQRMNAPASQQPEASEKMQPAKPEAKEIQKKPQISTIQRQEMPQLEEEEKDEPVQLKSETGIVQRVCSECDKEQQSGQQENKLAQMQPLVQRQSADKGMADTPDLETSIQKAQGQGQPLSDNIRGQMEQSFGADFSGVRIHTGSQSDQLNKSIQARAFTTGQDIFLRSGEYAPTSKQGQELLAHELTHVVQQNGSAVQSKVPSAAKTTSNAPNNEGVSAATKSSRDNTVQRVCSKCEDEKQDVNLQAKQVSDNTVEATPEVEASISQVDSQVDRPTIQRVIDVSERPQHLEPRERPEPTPENKVENTEESKSQTPEATTGSDDSDCDQPDNTSNTNKTNNTEPENQQSQQSQKCPSEENKHQDKKQQKPPKTQPLKGKLAERPAICRKQQKSTLQAFALMASSLLSKGIVAKRNLKDQSKAAKPETTPKNAQQTPTSTPQNLTATPATTTGEAVNPKTAKEKAEATTTATEAQGQLRTTDAEVARLASSKINFKLPKQEETDTDNNSAALEEQRAAASSMASNFFAEAASRVQTVTGLGQGISARINGVAETARASVMSTVQQQQDAVTAQINQQRTQVQNQAQASIAEIQQQYQATLRNISLRTAEVSQRIQTEYSNVFQKVDQQESDLLARIDKLYLQTFDQYIAAGDTVGNEATAVGEKWVKQWESEITDKYSNEDAVVEDRGHMRSTLPNPGKTAEVEKNSKIGKKASTAREVAKQYKEQVTEEATKQANNLVESKAKDIKGICCGIKEFRKQLQKPQEETLKAVIEIQQDAVLQVTEAQTKLTESANQTLQATLQSLNEQETAQLQILQGYGDRQVLAIERDAQKAIASLQKGVNQAANKLLTAVQDYYSEFQGMEAPNPDELSVTLAEILGQFDSSVGTVQKETEKGIAVSEDGITQGEQQAVSAVGAIAQTVMEESAAVVEEAKTSFNNLNQGITNTFNQLRDAYTQASNNFVEDTAKGLAQITQDSQNSVEQIYQKFSEALQKSVTQIETGLRDTLKCLETDIQNYAAKAVEDEPWWKTLLKALVFIAVIVVAIVLAPIGIGFVAGALGGGIAATIFASVAVGAALGAGLGALSQIANNAIDGKNLMEGVGNAALAGAIGGAIGGFGGAIGGALGNVGKLGVGLSKTLSKFGIETVFDTLGNIVGDLAAGNPITLEGVLMGAAISAGTYVATTKGTLRRLGKPGEKIQSFQERSSEAGMRSGAFVGGKVRSAFGGKVDTSVGSRSGVGVTGATPPEAEVKTSKTSVTSGRGVESPTVNRPDVDVTGVRPLETEIKAPRGLKPNTDVLMTAKEQEILEKTAPKDGDKLTPEELNTELKVAEKVKPKSISEGEFVEQRELPNDHQWKEKEDATLCRFSDKPYCVNNKLKSHDRKQRALLKQQGTLHEFDTREVSIVDRDQKVEKKAPPQEAVSKKAIAEEFSNALEQEGLQTFLSGGGAINWQGGSRPIADLDFRVSAEEVGFNNFYDPKGKAVLQYINQVVLANSRNHHQAHNAQAQEFHPVGKDGLTIGTVNWFGVEVSLSVVPSTPRTLATLKGNEQIPNIKALSLEELQRDKLKTMITRTKKGQESVKKVAQDLFDFLDMTRLINEQDGSAKSMSQHLNDAISHRMDEYTIANLEGMQLHHLSKEDLMELMKARVVLTAQAHTKGGQRAQAFQKLLENNPELKTELKNLLKRLSKLKITPQSKTDLRPWMAAWNDNPFFGPPKKGKPSRAALQLSQSTRSESGVDELLALRPKDFLKDRIPEQVSVPGKQVLQVLYLSGGFRALENSQKNIQTLEAFGLTRNQFSKAFTELRILKLVEGKQDGLHLTQQGEKKLFQHPETEGKVPETTTPSEREVSSAADTRSNVETPDAQRPETEGNAPETTAPSDRNTHFDVPQTAAKATDATEKAPEATTLSDRTTQDIPTTSRSDADVTSARDTETEVKPPDTITSDQRSTHYDEPEIDPVNEPDVVAKEKTTDGHEIKVLKDGRVIRCSNCQELEDYFKQTSISEDNIKQINTVLNEKNNLNDKNQFAKDFLNIIKEIDNTLSIDEINTLLQAVSIEDIVKLNKFTMSPRQIKTYSEVISKDEFKFFLEKLNDNSADPDILNKIEQIIRVRADNMLNTFDKYELPTSDNMPNKLDSSAFNQAKQDYKQGRLSLKYMTDRPPQNDPLAYIQAWEDYKDSLSSQTH